MVDNYLNNRIVRFEGGNDIWIEEKMSCGPSQASLFGPFLWNVQYEFLEMALLYETSTISFAVNTIIICRSTEILGIRVKDALAWTKRWLGAYKKLRWQWRKLRQYSSWKGDRL